MINLSVLLVPVVFFLTALSAQGETWSLQFYGGSAYNFTSPLRIDQSGEEEIKVDARYGTKAFEDSLYYAWRLGKWRDDHSWELELVHHKLSLKNKPPEIQRFEISHGLNLLTLNRGWLLGGFIYRAGLGAVIAYPDNITVRGRTQNGEYHLAGPTAQFAVEKRFYFWKTFFAALEGKLTASYARVPVAGGDAKVTNVAVHGLFGFGLVF